MGGGSRPIVNGRRSTRLQELSQIGNKNFLFGRYSAFMATAHGAQIDTCTMCEELRRLCARNEAALSIAQRMYRAALEECDAAAMPEIEEELKQTSAARKVIRYALQEHRARHSAFTATPCAA
jgi:hypothetical protein